MKIKFHYCRSGRLWHGFCIDKREHDLGLVAFDIYRALGFSELYLWRFSVQFFHKERKNNG